MSVKLALSIASFGRWTYFRFIKPDLNVDEKILTLNWSENEHDTNMYCGVLMIVLPDFKASVGVVLK
jgi:hypothetical protein